MIVAVNAVIGLAYYVRASVALFAPVSASSTGFSRAPAVVSLALGLITVAALVLGFAPQLVFDAL